MINTNATDKIVGFEYQKLIALAACFDGKEGSTVFLECLGDVSDGVSSSTEVKHHSGTVSLINRSIDFWKTLRNLVENATTYETYDELILHTTAAIQDGSVFDGWEKLPPKSRVSKVRSISSNETILKYHTAVSDASDQVLESILGKLIIKANQPDAEAQHKLLLDHPILKAIEPKKKSAVVDRLIGKISLLAVYRTDNWHITQDEFLAIFRSECANYIIDDLLFPIISKSKVDTSLVNKPYHFCNELKNIGYEEVIDSSILNYLRARLSQIEMLTERPNLSDALEEYEEGLLDEMELKKAQQMNSIKTNNDMANAHQYSRALFNDCMHTPLTNILGVRNVKMYFPRGVMHQIVDSSSFTWLFIGENDES